MALTRAQKIAVGIGGIITLWVLSGLLFGSPEKPVEAENEPDNSALQGIIKIEPRQSQLKTRYLTLNGVTEPERLTLIQAETTGTVQQILVKDGALVEAGTELLKLDERDRRSRVAEAQARVKQRQIEYDAAKKLLEKGFQSPVVKAGSAAELETAKRELREAELDLARTSIRAPYRGIIEEVLAEKGDLVGLGGFQTEPALVRIVEANPIIIRAMLSEKELGKVQEGTVADVTLANGVKASGILRYVASVAEPESRTFRVEVEVPNPDYAIPSGITAQLQVPAEQRQAYLVTSAVLNLDDTGKVGVKTVADDGTVQFHPVEILEQTPDGVWIGGLPSRINLVVQGNNFVPAGQQVDMQKYLVQPEAGVVETVPTAAEDGTPIPSVAP